MIIVIEGGDQAGKLTQSRMLERALKRQKVKAKLFHFPDYATPIGRQIRAYLGRRRDFAPEVIHCLLSANRWEKLGEIKAAQAKCPVLIMNRYYHSNIIYGTANGLKAKWLENLDAGLPRPDLVILLDVPHTESFRRQSSNRDKFEGDGEFLARISRAYRRMAKKKGWKVIDATGTRNEVHAQILKAVAKKMGP